MIYLFSFEQLVYIKTVRLFAKYAILNMTKYAFPATSPAFVGIMQLKYGNRI